MASKKNADGDVGALSLERVRPILEAMPDDTLVQPNMALQAVGMAALVLVDRATETDLAARLASLPAALWDKKTIDKLEDMAHAAIQIDIESAREEAADTGVRVDVALIEEATAVKERMLKTLDYNLGDQDSVARELADIRAGNGYLDLANDNTRLAILYVAHKKELAEDKKNYDPADAARAKELAARIRDEYRAGASRAGAYSNLRPRVFAQITRLFDEVRAGAAFVFRAEPAKLDGFEPLRVAAKVQSSKRSKKPTPVVVAPPADPTTPPATPAEPANGTTPAGPQA